MLIHSDKIQELIDEIEYDLKTYQQLNQFEQGARYVLQYLKELLGNK